MAERRSTRSRGSSTERSAPKRSTDNPLVSIGALWADTNKKGEFFKGAISRREDDKGVSDIDRLKEALDSLEPTQSLNVLAFWNDNEGENQPDLKLYISIYTPEAKGARGKGKRGGR